MRRKRCERAAPVEKGRKPAREIVLIECCRRAVTAVDREQGRLSGAEGAPVAAEEQHCLCWGEARAVSYKATCQSWHWGSEGTRLGGLEGNTAAARS